MFIISHVKVKATRKAAVQASTNSGSIRYLAVLLSHIALSRAQLSGGQPQLALRNSVQSYIWQRKENCDQVEMHYAFIQRAGYQTVRDNKPIRNAFNPERNPCQSEHTFGL
ncbi:hypothetical protein NPIL_413731 [Nephila pilipes]|uniref:Uncharacterized protein n=1 Tax=Nephila pilipes TaxID=299642 RepID=A0A8X6QSK6_NEPPI|nr:hypothetical protein NPIL_413731 [Nephila pilipes]